MMRYQYWWFVLLGICFSMQVQAQVARNFHLNAAAPDRSGAIGNSITDLLWKEGLLLVGSGYGLGTTRNNGNSWQNYSPAAYHSKGGVSALTLGGDGTIWIATAYDSLLPVGGKEDRLPVGGGLRYLESGSRKWQVIPQPVDAVNNQDPKVAKPTTTRVQNLSFDVAVRNNHEVWIASFGGGLRRSPDRGKTWEVVTTDGKLFDADAFLNHRAFSVIVDSTNTLWVGTAEGISKSTDGGKTWRRFLARPGGNSISGNFVIGLWHRPWDNSIWATTLQTVPNERNAISMTRNGGDIWEVFLEEALSDGTKPRYIAFQGAVVYVATENGFYKSDNDGKNWFKLPTIRDRVSGEGLFTSTFYSAVTTPAAASGHRLWVGSLDGLAATDNNGYDWTVFRRFVSTRSERSKLAVYAYPNPYSPLHSDRPCRFQFDIQEASQVTIDIYNFAMEKVITLSGQTGPPQGGYFDRSLTWNGLDNNGRIVDNGVYFFRAKIARQVTWGKIVLIN